MKLIETRKAVGHVLCHDLTRIVKDEFKGAQFTKGHVVTEDDIPMLLSMGKEHLYVWEMEEGMLHENEAAKRLYDICANDNIRPSQTIKEGKIEAFAECDGEVFIIGGGSVYAQALEYADTVYMTHVRTEIADADTFFPELSPRIWKSLSSSPEMKDEESGLIFSFEVYGRACP